MINLLNHKSDLPNYGKVSIINYNNNNNKAGFGVFAEWHYFATAHDKGPSHGLGGTLKRLATRK